MKGSEAIEILKQELLKIPRLRQLAPDNQEFTLWREKVINVINAGLAADDRTRFSLAVPIRLDWSWLQTNRLAQADAQAKYIEDLNSCETALKSIIQKYEILGLETAQSTVAEPIVKAFISHGKESVALSKVKEFLSALGIEPVSVRKQPSLDKTLDDKVDYYLNQADFVVILATGDDVVDGKRQPRQNVSHEIGLAQKTHAGKIIYLLEEEAEFSSNIGPKVWEPFNQNNMENVFVYIVGELRAFGVLNVTKGK